MLGLDEVEAILDGARHEAREHGWSVSIAVVDDGGHQLAMLRLDGAAPLTAYMAVEKARTAALGRRESKFYEDMVNGGRFAFLSAPLNATLEGAIPVVVSGECIGAVGVSGVKSDQDAQVARAGITYLAAMDV